ncbi:MAG TPA: PIN domain-containing protein [Thermoanaerobaculia bacterium]|jgi:predicted nucleic acid-binding protein|nr:PIN domain-containing protein [Thermoanaerobaculia bacterium]
MLRTLDALHLAVVAELGSSVATFDTRLAEAAQDLGFEVLP